MAFLDAAECLRFMDLGRIEQVRIDEFNFGIQFFISDANVQDITLLFNQIDKQKQGFLDLNCF